MPAGTMLDESWIERLVDLSRRNNLLFFRHLKRGTLDLTNADREALDDLFGDTAVGPERLLPDADADRLAAQVLDISRRAQANRDVLESDCDPDQHADGERRVAD